MNDKGLAPRDDFFVGYGQDVGRDSPYARVMRRFVEILALFVVLLGVLIPSFQGSPGDGRFDDTIGAWEGVVRTWPAPLLELEHDGGVSWALLVNEFKQGAGAHVRALAGSRVRVSGRRIAREGVEMIELLAGEDGLRVLGPGDGRDRSPVRASGRVEALGEVMDPKCYLGAMRPGRGKAHLACAARCLEGGIPPLFVADRIRTEGRATEGARHYLLVRADGEPVGASAARMVGVPTALEGEVLIPERLGGDSLAVLRVSGSEGGWVNR